MVTFPNCKINLGLNVIRKRDDGFHELESVFFPVPLCDILEITESSTTELVNTGLEVGCDMGKNLCYKAYTLLKKEFDLPPVRIHLHKIIPFGAGLGGGSSDAAFTLKMLNEIFRINLSVQKMEQFAAQIGSDCAFFIANQPAIARGRGEILEEIPLDLSFYKILLIKPAIHISTAEAYAGIKPKLPDFNLEKTIKSPVNRWKFELKNDFETHLFEKYPELPRIKNNLYNEGAHYASMSGSGSTIFGLFEKDFDTSKVKASLSGFDLFEKEL